MTEERRQEKKKLMSYSLGAHLEADGVRFAFVSAWDDCGVLIYDRVTGKLLEKIAFLPEERLGNIYCKLVERLDAERITYQFYEGERIVPDRYARGFTGHREYGESSCVEGMRAILTDCEFDWEDTVRPELSYRDVIAYCMHVRGFTLHESARVEHGGTFLGIVEKLDYLKETGITTVELQPAYEFEEFVKGKGLNYWGYKRGFYYVPKAAYAASQDARWEFKTMVKEFHKRGMEVVMQFYFPKEVPVADIPDILRYWVLEYRVDGFHLKGEGVPLELLATDALLADTKLWYESWEKMDLCKRVDKLCHRKLAEYKDDYYYTMRRFLKGDDGVLGSALYQMRHVPENVGRIHYMSNYYGLTLCDMVSYNDKHNEDNGELNRDGMEANCSWNCGEEGSTRNQQVLTLRSRQWKNAVCMLLLSQSAPLIFMGDEFGNSQQGNNNPYGLDNEITWLNWEELERNQEWYGFWKQMVALRNEYPLLRPEKEYRLRGNGGDYPPLSYHGQKAWSPLLDCFSHQAGILFCGGCGDEKGTEKIFLYVAINMHWEEQELALPKIPKGMKWALHCTTGELFGRTAIKVQQRIPPRSTVIYKSIKG